MDLGSWFEASGCIALHSMASLLEFHMESMYRFQAVFHGFLVPTSAPGALSSWPGISVLKGVSMPEEDLFFS